MTRISLISGSLLALGAAQPVAAQLNAAAPDTDDAPPIVVTGAGLPATPATPAYDTVVLDREALLATGSGRIEDALASVAGFQQFRRSDSRSANPSAQGVTLRALGGNASSRAQVLLDGVPMADPFFGYIPFSAIAPERLASARVTRGGGSGPFGAGALAGTIELTSAGANALGLVSGQALVNDRGESELSGTLAPHLGAGFVTVSGRWDQGQGFWTTPPDQRVPASVRASFEAWSVQLRTVAAISDTIELQARALAFRDARTLRFAGADTTSEGQDGSLRLVGRGSWQFDLLGYVQARNFTNTVVSSTLFVPTLDQRATPATGIGGKFELRPPTGESNVLRLGADYRRSSGQLFEDAISVTAGTVTERRTAGGVTSDLGLFVENDLILGRITLTAGARVDRFAIANGFYRARNAGGMALADTAYASRSGWESSFRGGAVVRLGTGLLLRGAAYTGLRLPTLNELYRPFTVVRLVTQANAELRNERLVGYEAGIDVAPSSGFSFSLTVFDNRVKHAIANVTLAPDLRQRQNIAAISARGVEGSALVKFGAVEFAGSLAVTDAVARGTGSAAGLNGKRPAQTPRWLASGSLSWHPRAGARLAATLRHVSAQFEDDLEAEALAAATTLDLFAQWPLWHRLALVTRAENLTDAQVITRNQGGSIDLGAPRTWWIGIRLGH